MKPAIGWALCGMLLVATASARAAEPTAEDELHALEQEWVDAEIRRDADTLRRILDERFVATFGSGPPLDREAFIRAVVSGTSTDVTQTLSDATVVVDRDTAVVVGTDTVRGIAKGAPFLHVYRYTATYVRRDGRWVALAEHLVRAPEAK